MAPGSRVASECIVALGAVVTGDIDAPRSLVAGVPARAIRVLNGSDLDLVHLKTRPDIPDGFYDTHQEASGPYS